MDATQSVWSAGGIQLWSKHPLLDQSQLSNILAQIEPVDGEGLQPILNWQADDGMRDQWHTLSKLVESKIPADVPLTPDEKTNLVRDKIYESVNAFSIPRPELNQKSLQSYVTDLIGDLTNDDFGAKGVAGRQLFKVMSWSLFLQDVADNPRYNPHDYRHALVVAKWMADLAQAEPELLKSFADKYHCTNSQALALIQLSGLLHDCGYPFMADSVEPSGELSKDPATPSLTKATHAVVGGLMFHVLVQPVLSRLLSDQGVQDVQQLCREMMRAIHLHSSDSPTHECGHPIQVSTEGGGIYQVGDEVGLSELSQQLSEMGDPIVRAKVHDCSSSCLSSVKSVLPKDVPVCRVATPLPAARELDAKWLGDRAIATPCVKVDRQKVPMAYWMMFADNLDLTHKRLGKVQGSGVYGRAMLKFHSASELQGHLNNLKTQIQDYYDNQQDYADAAQWPDSPASVLFNVCASSKKDIDYLVGLLSVAQVSLKQGREGQTVLVQLQSLPSWVKEQGLSKEEVIHQMGFQVERLKSALTFLIDAPSVEVVWPNCLFKDEVLKAVS